jgi:ADP-ribosylglycohydrolase
LRIRLGSLLTAYLLIGLGGVSAYAERTITAVDLFDKLRGMWIGQLIGNAAGRATEGVYAGSEPDPNSAVPWQIKQIWDADDDTDIEYVALHILESCGFECDPCEIAEQWLAHIGSGGIYIANKQAWYLMLDGHVPPETGSRAYNEHWYSIDAQIGTETLGAVSPGLPQAAIDLAGKFGRTTNAGLAVHAAQFYAAMYAEAFFEPNVVELVTKGLDGVPESSRTAQVVSDVLDWYLEDAADGALDWRATRGKLYEHYQGVASLGRYYNWVESTINLGATVLALLYGQGDFKQTVQIAVLAGWDCDCNPATAGGLLGIVHGFSGLPPDLTDPASCGDLYMNVSRPGLPNPTGELPQYDSIMYIALRLLILARENILRNGGYYATEGRTGLYHIPEPEPLVAEADKPDPIGPAGLVGEALAAGIAVTPRASVQRFDESMDRNNLYAIIDGVTDNSYNGHRPYYTYVSDPAARPEQDWYELAFSTPVTFERVTFYEGDIVWAKINSYYRDDEPLGGFFEDLTVQVLHDGEYVEPEGVLMSADLDRFQMYQTITFSFAPTVGEAIRIIGTPGGMRRFTTVLELEAEGTLLADPPGQ